jgi:hypothetical protein
MESWEGYNYYTTNTTRWVELMNYSTFEWGLGYFPPNVHALPGVLNSSHNFPNDTYVIEYAGRSESGNRATEKIVFGIVSAIAIVFIGIWLWFNRKTLFHPRNSSDEDLLPHSNSPTSSSTAIAELTPLQDDKFWGMDRFKHEIFNFYYEPVETEVELYEKTLEDGVDTEDIESVTALRRGIYSSLMHLWACQSNLGNTEEQDNEKRRNIAAMQEEVGRRIREWIGNNQNAVATHANWNNGELEVLNELINFIEKRGREPPFHEQRFQ